MVERKRECERKVERNHWERKTHAHTEINAVPSNESHVRENKKGTERESRREREQEREREREPEKGRERAGEPRLTHCSARVNLKERDRA